MADLILELIDPTLPASGDVVTGALASSSPAVFPGNGIVAALNTVGDVDIFNLTGLVLGEAYTVTLSSTSDPQVLPPVGSFRLVEITDNGSISSAPSTSATFIVESGKSYAIEVATFAAEFGLDDGVAPYRIELSGPPAPGSLEGYGIEPVSDLIPETSESGGSPFLLDGIPVSASINSAGDSDAFVLPVETGDVFLVTAKAAPGGALDVAIPAIVRDPPGAEGLVQALTYPATSQVPQTFQADRINGLYSQVFQAVGSGLAEVTAIGAFDTPTASTGGYTIEAVKLRVLETGSADSISGDATNPAVLDGTDFIEATVASRDDVDVFTFAGIAGRAYRINLFDPAGLAQPIAEFRSTDPDQPWTTATIPGGGVVSPLTLLADENGVVSFALAHSGLEGRPDSFDYRLSIVELEDAIAADGTTAEAVLENPFDGIARAVGLLETAQDVDGWRIALTSGQNYEINLSGPDWAAFKVIAPDGAVVAAAANAAATGVTKLVLQPTVTGEYRIEARMTDYSFGTSPEYTLTVATTTNEPDVIGEGPTIAGNSLARDGAMIVANETVTGNQSASAVAGLPDGGFVLSWVDRTAGNIAARLFDRDGQARTPEIIVASQADPANLPPALTVLDDGTILVAWQNDKFLQNTPESTVKAQLLGLDGQFIGTTQTLGLVSKNSGYNTPLTSIELSDGRTALTWITYSQSETGEQTSFTVTFLDAAGRQEGAAIQLSAQASASNTDFRVAPAGEAGFAAVWRDWSTGALNLQFFGEQGQSLSDVATIATPTFEPAAITALSDGSLVVVWVTSEARTNGASTAIYAQKYSSSGTAEGDVFYVNDAPADRPEQLNISSLRDGGFAIGWTADVDEPSNSNDIFVRVFTATGEPRGVEAVVNALIEADQIQPAISALADGRFVVTYTDRSLLADGDGSAVTAQIIAFEAIAPSAITLPILAVAENAAVAQVVSDIVITDANLNASHQLEIISDSSGGAVSISDGKLVVGDPTKLDFETVTSIAVTIRATDEGGLSVTRDFVIAVEDAIEGYQLLRQGDILALNSITVNDQTDVRLAALPGGGFVATWTDDSQLGPDTSGTAVKARFFNTSGQPTGEEFLVNTKTGDRQTNPAVTVLADGNILISWTDEPNRPDVRAQIISPTGQQVGDEFVVNTSLLGDQSVRSVTALENGGFVITWNDSAGDSSSFAVKARVFSPAGISLGDEIRINQSEVSYQFHPSVTGLADGGFLISWADWSGDGGGESGIRARTYNADGTARTDEFFVERSTTNLAENTEVTRLANGNVVVSWIDRSGNFGDVSGWSVRARILDASGVPIGESFNVNTGTIGEQWEQTIAALPGGGFVVTWTEDRGFEFGAARVRGQIFDAAGAPVGQEFAVSPPSDAAQIRPSVTVLADGRIAIAWQDQSQVGADESGFGIKATIYSLGPQISSLGGASSATLSVNENQTEATTLVAIRPEDSADIIYSVSGGTDAALFEIDSVTGKLSFRTAPDFEVASDADADNTYEVVVRASATLGFTEQALTIRVTDLDDTTVVNTPPLITSDANYSITENSTAIGQIAATDAETPNSIAFTIASGADASAFAIDALGNLEFITAPDYEAPADQDGDNIYEVVIRVTDGDNAFSEKSFVIAVTDSAVQTSGVVADGYIAGATVYIDTDGDGVLDDNEVRTLSDASGNFSLVSDQAGTIRAVGGSNIDTGLANLLVLSAPEGASVVNPLTTLLQAAVESGASLETAQSDILAAFGLDLSLELATFDILAAPEGDLIALQAQKAATTINLIVEAVLSNSGPAGSPQQDTLTALVTRLGTGPIDFSNPETLSSLFAETLGNLSQAEVALLIDDVSAEAAAIAEAPTIAAISAIQVNRDPTGSASAVLNAAAEDVAFAITTEELLQGFVDLDGDILFIEGLTASTGAITGPVDGVYTITPDANFNGTVTLSYSVIDGKGGTNATTLSYMVVPLNDAPTLSGPEAALPGGQEDIVTRISVADLLQGYSDVDGDHLSISGLTASAGSISGPLDGAYALTMPANGFGTVVLSYVVTDGNGGDVEAQRSVSITAVNDAPIVALAPQTQTVNEDTNWTYTLPAGTFIDVDGDALTYSASLADGSPLPSWLTFEPGLQRFTGTPPLNFNGSIELRVRASDDQSSITTGFNVAVAAVNDRPTWSTPAIISVQENATTVATLSAADVETPSSLRFEIVGGADALKFGIAGNQLSFITAQDFEAPGDINADNVFEVVVRVFDAEGAFSDQALSISLRDVAEGINRNVVLSTRNDLFVGQSGVNWNVDGLRGDDLILTGNGEDTVRGNSGNDVVNTGAGNDTITYSGVAEGFDSINGGTGTDRVIALSANTVIGLRSLTGIETISGGGFADVRIQGSSAADVFDFSEVSITGIVRIDGGDGNDTIIGSSGNDTIFGNSGTDLINSGAGSDTILFGASTSDTINGGLDSDTLLAQSANASVLWTRVSNIETVDGNGFAGVTIAGGGGSDTLDLSRTTLIGVARIDAGGGSDTIIGSGAADVIVGGSGRDVITGGSGADRFTFAATSDSRVGLANADLITDFTRGSDKLDFSAIDASTRANGNQAFSFVGTASFSGGAGQLRVEHLDANEVTRIFGDVNGDRIADFEVDLAYQDHMRIDLQASDFLL